jgi:large subunit ribosomal protein L4
MQVDIHNTDIQKVGDIDLPDAVFAADVKAALLWEQVRAQRASRRRGTHSTKDRSQVSGTGAKPFRQKGTGNARQGSRRAPHFVGGGVSQGPRPRVYTVRLPRSARRAALKSALSVRCQEQNLLVLDKFDLDAPKTKEVAAFLGKLGTSSALIVDVDNGNLKMSTRNIPKSKFVAAEGVNVYDILNHEKLVVTQASLDAIIKKALGEAPVAADQGAA